eukprot:15481917-Alexandrium_andersonii.AAC.1
MDAQERVPWMLLRAKPYCRNLKPCKRARKCSVHARMFIAGVRVLTSAHMSPSKSRLLTIPAGLPSAPCPRVFLSAGSCRSCGSVCASQGVVASFWVPRASVGATWMQWASFGF